MPSLVFNKGYKEYDINGDKSRIIRVPTSDWNILQRIAQLRGKIADKVSALGTVSGDAGFDAVMQTLDKVEREVRAELDAAFGSAVSETAFGDINCLSFAGGKPIVLNFLEAILPEIRRDLEAEAQQADAKVEKYTEAVKAFD